MDLTQIVEGVQNFFARDISLVINDLQKLFTIVALVIGGIWAYFNFFKGRTYRPRLELQIDGRVMCKEETSYVAVRVRMKNVGLTKFEMQRESSGLKVSSYETLTDLEYALSPRAEPQGGVFSMFQFHQWIEPGETIEDEHLVAVPGCEHLAFLLEYRIPSKRITWRARTIIDGMSDPNERTRNHTTPISHREDWTVKEVNKWTPMEIVLEIRDHLKLTKQMKTPRKVSVGKKRDESKKGESGRGEIDS